MVLLIDDHDVIVYSKSGIDKLSSARNKNNSLSMSITSALQSGDDVLPKLQTISTGVSVVVVVVSVVVVVGSIVVVVLVLSSIVVSFVASVLDGSIDDDISGSGSVVVVSVVVGVVVIGSKVEEASVLADVSIGFHVNRLIVIIKR